MAKIINRSGSPVVLKGKNRNLYQPPIHLSLKAGEEGRVPDWFLRQREWMALVVKGDLEIEYWDDPAMEIDPSLYDDADVSALVEMAEAAATQIQFLGEPFSATVGEPISIPVAVTDAQGDVVTISKVSEVTVKIYSDETSGATIGGGTDPVVVPLVKGKGEISVLLPSSGEVTLELIDSAESGLSVDDTADVIA